MQTEPGPESRGAQPAAPAELWSGAWAAERLGITLTTTAAPVGLGLEDLVGVAVRRNPRRAQLLVSRVLGKHVPVHPLRVLGTGMRLGGLVRALGVGEAVVLGYAETATGLGHSVADALGAPILHSTRRPVLGVAPVGGFEEEHSHATSHLLLPDLPLLEDDRTLVLVDDEFSTGTTLLNTIRTLHSLHPRSRYVIAALVDLRSPDDVARMDAVAAELGVTIEAVALASGRVELPDGVLEAGQALVAELDTPPDAAPPDAAPPGARDGVVTRLDVHWPANVREGGRHGFTPHDPAFDAAVEEAGTVLAEALPEGAVHVLGTEELIYAPLRIAGAFAARRGDAVTFSTTSRTPVLAVDEPGYAIRTALTFPAHDAPADGPGPRFAYNLRPGAYDAVVVVVDEPADTPELFSAGGLVDRLRGVTDRVVVVTLPAYAPTPAVPAPNSADDAPVAQPQHLPAPLRGPAFGSYPAEDVAWLLKDLSDAELEAPTEEREEAIQAGRAHYAESLPVEYQPDAAYQALFAEALTESADRLAYAVGLVTEQVLALRGRETVLVSLARAGTPVGVLMRRWARAVHGLDVPHYAISIVRGRGIDEVALAYLAAHHDPDTVMFVDGWTGKGAITRELAASVEKANARLLGGGAPGGTFSADLAVLADPGRCVEVFGTREDYLIPSACLNSTVSGLVSRTVLNDELIGPGDFHGAKFYADLAEADVSRRFVDTVAARFAAVRTSVLSDLPGRLAALRGGEHRPTWDGWRVVEEVSASYGIGEVNLVKPGVGETTRVLLRRVPWKVLVNPERAGELAHVRVLAEQRGVPLEEVPGLPYSCIGLIHPRFTRGAVLADGRGTGA
ncbi:phosphoribosyltransferase [Nocardioides sp. DS6]|uniref:Phosphoribosyltransferase n=1 Tax=Nocardioides eburneus TaxID=3231482 RepID=A0ABV3T316_9ACTN